MTSFSNLTETQDITPEADVLGGSKFGPLESGVYPNVTIKMAYTKIAPSGAMAVELLLACEDGHELRQTLWVQSGTAKGQKNFYVTKKGEKRYLPGYEVFAAITKLATGKSAADLTTEEKTIQIWSYDEKKDVPTSVNVVMDLLNQQITLGLQKQIVDKKINVAPQGSPAEYKATGETREENEIRKVFRAADGMTTTEVAGGAANAEFLTLWAEKNTGKTVDKSDKDVQNRPLGTLAPSGSSQFGAATAADKPTAPVFGG